MGKGLDELIESLLTEIAFSGSRGCRVTNLLAVIRAFYRDGQGIDAGSDVTLRGKGPEIEPDDLVVASKVWRWLVARPDVSVGVNRKFNHLSLEAVLGLPEDEDDQALPDLGPTSSKVPAKPSRAGQSDPGRVSRNSGKGLDNYRPRLHVSEERQWRILTGHGPDFKRVPAFEWRALVDIASVKEKGILQGDLVRLTGQDKRSLPTRTDALAKKGYIIKQPILLRGCRSSKIWLAQFAEKAREDADRDGLQYDKIDLSAETLTKDLDPVPFSQKWNGERLDYLAIAQAFIAVVKAWGLIRYCDVRAKLDVEERVPQMRALAKTSRWLTSIGSVTFVAARFSNNHRLFKDCVKFLREPTPAEWKIFRTTPKARLNIPSQRVGARGVASRARHEALSKSRGKSKKNAKRTPREGDKVTPSLWAPQKPITNTVFEIIKRSGAGGSSNASIGRQTIGHAYRKYTAALNAALSFPNSQPQHLEHLSVTSNLTRMGKTMTYQFFATNEMVSSSATTTGDKVQAQEVDRTAPVPAEQTLNTHSVVNKPRTFSQPIESKFASPTSSSLSSLSRAMSSIKNAQVRQQNSKRKRKRVLDDAQGEQPSSKRRGRPPKPKVLEPPTTIAADEPRVNPQLDTSPNITSGTLPTETQNNEVASIIVQESSEPPKGRPDTPEAPEPRPPGVYRAARRPLEPGQKRKGRPKRSCVVIFRSDRLKDPSFLGVTEATEEQSDGKPTETSNLDNNAADSAMTPPNSIDTNSASIPTVQESTQTKESPIIQRRGPRRGKTKSHKCEKCGSSWRNSNGLEYHLNKSQTTCNPDFVPPPRHPSPQPNLKQRNIKPLASWTPGRQQKAKGGGIDPQSSRRSTPSIRVRAMRSLTGTISEGTPKPASTRGSILLQDLQTYDVIDRETLQSHQSTPRLDGTSTPDIIRRDSVPRQLKKRAGRLHQTQGQKDGEVGLASTGSHRIIKEFSRGSGAQDPKPGVSAAIAANSTKSMSNAQDTLVSSNTTTNNDHFLNPEPKPQDKLLLPPLRGPFPDIAPRKHQSESSILASFKTCKPGNTSLGAQRRERTSKIIEYLLDHNSGVFPGNKSLYLVLVSLWNREYDDLAPPDRKMCQSTVSKMDKAGVLKQLHFFFLDGRGNMQDCAILVKVREDDDQLNDLSTDPKVIAIKEKMREMFPETYIPEAFSLSEMEIELFDALDSKHRGSQHDNTSTSRQKVDETRDVEVLQYPMPVMVDIPINATTSKRPRESDDDQSGQTSKKLRIDAQGVGKIQSNRKYRKRPESEFWDSGKLALYLWNQKQNHVGKWDETSTHLQDPGSGAWSWNPEANNQSSPGIESILSSVKSTRENDAHLRRRSSTRYKLYRAHTEEFGDIGDDAMGYIDTLPDKVQSIDRFVEPSTSASFTFEDIETEEDDDDFTMEDAQDVCATDDNTSAYSGDTAVRFSQVQSVRDTGHGSWPRLKADFFESHTQGFTLVGSLPSSKWFQKENLPRSISDIPRTARGPALSSWADPLYGKFMRDLAKIERWEQSVEGTHILSHGSVAPEYIFLSLSSDKSKANMEPCTVEWPSRTQYTTENMPDEILNATQEDEDFGLPSPTRAKKIKDTLSRPQVKRTRYNRLLRDDWNTTPGLGIEYKTRLLTAIPRQPRGRSTHPRPINGEAELIAAFVVFRTLIGGVDQTVDMGLVMKYFPEMSLSALKKFWPRIMRERKTYVDALTTKFQASFLEAYERGDFATLDYNNLEDYDWGSLITWTARLETHQDVSLPTSLHALNEAYLLEDPINEVVDWREIWFSQASVYNRIEAAAGESISIPIPSIRDDQAILSLARSWVRSLCCTSIKGADSPEKIRKKLLQLANGDEASVNRLLGKVISKLRLEKLVVRAKGKIMGQSFRLHAQFVKQLDKLSRAEKFTQATMFKSQLDESFRANKEFLLPYASDDGTIMAIINLQTAGRIRADATDIPNIPFGFEPGNYEGRLFPKSYYHFQIRLVPTQTYMYDEDMPLLQEAKNKGPPTEGPQGEIPIWVDFFGKLNRPRWIEYLSMMVFALATKGPLTPASATVLLKPVIDEFEAKLIMDWLDALGLLQRVESENGATMAEWWWLVVGQLINVKGKNTK
ncbi:hypothetical protein F4809DRAFT_460687 [Biscogniauxia mediterranea]|nr:hypothetical protein F4809DRAFT_460687 [Biscogniauxia mediterranea]